MSVLAAAAVMTGLDILIQQNFAPLEGRKVALITNHTGLSRDGKLIVDLLHESPKVNLVSLFSPEHGLRGELDATVSDGVDEKTGLKINSLYDLNKQGEDRYKPNPADLNGADIIVFDIQDVGARFYTYHATMGYAMEVAASEGIDFLVLDRPNPIGGIAVEGPISTPDFRGFTAFHNIATRHGMTFGEMAIYFNEVRSIGCDLEVIWCEGWRRADYWDATGLPWVNPSPNMRSPTQAVLYPGIALVEASNISVGRGTDTPFEHIGAPYIDGKELAAELNALNLPGVRAYPKEFTSDSSKFKDQKCGGVAFIVTSREDLDSVRLGCELAAALHRLYPEWEEEKLVRLLHNQQASDLLLSQGYFAARSAWEPALQEFLRERARFLRYR